MLIIISYLFLNPIIHLQNRLTLLGFLKCMDKLLVVIVELIEYQNLSKSAWSASLLYFTPSLDFSVQISSTSPIVRRSRSRIEIPTSQHRRRNSGVVISRSLLPVLFLPLRPSSGCRPTAPGSAGAPGRLRTSRTDPATHRWSWGWKDPREKP